jgi:hypothetical protein
MRKVQLDDVRLIGARVVAAPLWAYRDDGDGYLSTYRRIDALWSDVTPRLEAIAEALRRRHEEKRAKFEAMEGSPNRAVREDARNWLSWDRKDPPSFRPHVPDTFRGDLDFRTCDLCGERFLSTSSRTAATCSARCLRARCRRRLRRPYVVHMSRPCDHCGEPFTPTRADAQYCSGRCRVAHHRAKV